MSRSTTSSPTGRQKTFDELEHPLIVNTVDINSGMQVLWGLPGLRYARVADAVFACCALPGILPPAKSPAAGTWTAR